MKLETVGRYLGHMDKVASGTSLDPRYKATPKNRKDEQELDDGEHEKPMDRYGWLDTFGTHSAADRNPTNLPSIDYVEPTSRNYVEELSRKWPMSETHLRASSALAFATHVYVQLDGAIISLKVVETSLNETPWFTEGWNDHFTSQNLRPNTLACIAHFESGVLLVNPYEFEETFAIASGNSIFVIGSILSDPFEFVATSSVKRIIGNIDRTGVCMLVAPCEPRVRVLGDQYNLVEHAPYDGKREDSFKGTSLHLSFTDWAIPLEVKGGEGRTIDQEAYLVESVISVLDSGRWVADLDILCIDFETLTKLRPSHHCPIHANGFPDYDYTSLDS